MEATRESIPTTPTASEFAELARELVQAAEAGARERAAQRIAALLDSAAQKRSQKVTIDRVPRRVMDALLEAQRMTEAAESIVRDAIDGAGVLDFPKLQALRACLQCVGNAVEPALDAALLDNAAQEPTAVEG
ncbi:MAG: hypothetical protein JNJ71_02020 [Rubrivivax sp.]|nr:hypothetical protein [Rubrivivax sp.]